MAAKEKYINAWEIEDIDSFIKRWNEEIEKDKEQKTLDQLGDYYEYR